MNESQKEISASLSDLFGRALSNGGIEYIYTLVRVAGLSLGVRDPLLALRSVLQASDAGLLDEELPSQYCSIAGVEEPFSLVANLLNCACARAYSFAPFRHLYTGQFPDIVKPTASQRARELVKLARADGMPQIAQLIDDAYPEELLADCASSTSPSKPERFREVLQKCQSFLTSLLEIYFSERLQYRDRPRLYKLRGFEVLELLINDDQGLYGFRMHFSNGSSAVFARHPESTECTNLHLTTPIGFWVGDLDQLRHEWRVGDKRLYEVGLPGRYNELGEWKPIIYPGNSEALQKDARSLSQDHDVQGALFYMMCTGHRVVEFVVRTSIELPLESVTFGEKLHLWKCPPLDSTSALGQTDWIYDGWLELDSTDPGYIKSAIEMIGLAVNRMAFAYGGAVHWRVKYRMVADGRGCAIPTAEDLHVLDSILRKFPQTEDAVILDAAVDWYNLGTSSRNPFLAFLCYYIALESVALAVADGHADLGLEYSQEGKAERRELKIDCIRDKHTRIYSEDPLRFAQEAYLDCILSLKAKTHRVAELVFGPGHRYLKALFEKRDGYSLNDIRGKLAHGGVTLLDREDESLVRGRLHWIAAISKEFLSRVIFLLKPADSLPSWSQRHRISLSMADPRGTMVTSHEEILPTADWRIGSEWCE